MSRRFSCRSCCGAGTELDLVGGTLVARGDLSCWCFDWLMLRLGSESTRCRSCVGCWCVLAPDVILCLFVSVYESRIVACMFGFVFDVCRW